MKRSILFAFTFAVVLTLTGPLFAGAIFLTGHDPDFHALPGENAVGAQNINNAAISYIMDPLFNTFAAGGANKWIFVEGKFDAPSGHRNGVDGMVASGFVAGVDFDHHDFTTLGSALDELGSTYGGIVVASDFGGRLSQAELDILNARSADIIDFLNAGGGIYAMAESNGGDTLTPNGGHFDFLPFVVTSSQFDQFESGNTLTPFGMSLGLTTPDVNGNFSHNVFVGTFGLNIVDYDLEDQILSLAGRIQIPAPEPSTVLLLAAGLTGLAFRRRKR